MAGLAATIGRDSALLSKIKTFVQERRNELSFLGKPLQIVIVGLLVLLPAALLLWIFDQLFIFFLARSYVDDIAVAFNINKHLAKAMALVVFVMGVYFVSKLFSLSKSSRLVGKLGLVALLIAHALFLWQGTKNQFFDTSGKAIKCYILSRDGEVRYLERPGIDAVTGRLCREVTSETLERLQAYAKGKRPERIFKEKPEFFDPRTGEPIVWFWRSKSGAIELFNLMGFHPERGEELQPVSRDVVEAFKAQVALQKQEEERREQEEERKRRPPQRIDPDNFEFFDAVSGKPRAWYWRGEGGEYEFYDNQGFRPRTGEALKLFDAEAIATWERETARRKQEQLRREKEQRERSEREERKQQEALERQQREQEKDLERRQLEAQAGSQCDQLAANPNDPRKPSDVTGVHFDELKEHAAEAVKVCYSAMAVFPDEARYRYQYARALGFSEPDKAIGIYGQLTRQKYPAAFDNLGSLLWQRKNNESKTEAINVFKEGVRLGDPDSMVSLAGLIGSRYVPVPNPFAAKYALLKHAAGLGHEGAKLAVERMEIELQQQQQERASQQQQEQMMLQLFGNILGGAIRRH